MTRIWTDGFEMGDLAGYGIAISGQSEVTNTGAQARSGNRSILLVSDYQNSCGFTIPFSESIARPYARVSVRREPATVTGTWPALCSFSDALGAIQITLVINKDTNLIQLHRGRASSTSPGSYGELLAIGSTSLQLYTWYCIEVNATLDGSNGIVQVRVDGALDLDIDYSGNTRWSGTQTTFGLFGIGYVGATMVSASAQNGYYDDVAVDNSDWCGPGSVIYLPADADSSPLDWTRSNGAISHYEHVSEVPTDGDATYLSTATAGDISKFTVDNVPSEMLNRPIQRVWVESRMKKLDADSSVTAQLGIDSNVTEVYSSDLSLLTNYTNRVVGPDYTANPDDSLAWEVADINNVEIMVKATEP